MSIEFKHLPVILLMGKNQQGALSVQEWLGQSRFRIWEAPNVFDALEGIADFTLRNRPDVILVNVESIEGDFQLLTELLLRGETGEIEFPIFALSAGDGEIETVGLFEGDLAQIKARLGKLIPVTAVQARSALFNLS